jgi:hypothetical protein
MILPSQLSPPTTETAGYFRSSVPVFAEWLVKGLGQESWNARNVPAGSLAELVRMVQPRVPLRRYLVLPVARWTVLLNDGPLGTDVGMLPSHAARELGCVAVRAVAGRGRFAGTILEVYDPDSDDPLLCRRAVYAADDGGRWAFGESGERFPFEEVDAYRRRLIRDRFTPELLERYLMALGVPVDLEPDLSAAVLLEHTG